MSDSLERLVAYLQENVGRYSLQSVRDALLRQGHDPALVNAAIAEYDRRQHAAAAPAPPPAPATGRPIVWPYVLVAILINSGLAAVAGMAALSVPMHQTSDTSALHFTVKLFLVEAVGALLMMPTGKLRRLGCGILAAILLGSAVGLLSFVGYCAANI
ncbi:MAG TPA: hypothetical protein VGM86_20630 [Thermoanaerobaculia bacterium]|jgi:hypothetical protein